MKSSPTWKPAGNGLRKFTPTNGRYENGIARGLAKRRDAILFCARSEKGTTTAFTVPIINGPAVRAKLGSNETVQKRWRACAIYVSPTGEICGSYVNDQMQSKAAAWHLNAAGDKAEAKTLIPMQDRAAVVSTCSIDGKLVYLITYPYCIELLGGKHCGNLFGDAFIPGRPEGAVSTDGRIIAATLDSTKPSTSVLLDGKAVNLPVSNGKLTAMSPNGMIAISVPDATAEEATSHLFRPTGAAFESVAIPSETPQYGPTQIPFVTDDGWFVGKTKTNEWCIGSLSDGGHRSLAGFLNGLDYSEDGDMVDEVHGIYSDDSGLYLLLRHFDVLNLVQVTDPKRGF